MDSTRWSTVASVLRAAGFPFSHQDLLHHARQQKADDRTIALIAALPVGIFRNLIDVAHDRRQAG
nr:DUF2795 domain-containing protein [uncultured Actinoplanes sp.]